MPAGNDRVSELGFITDGTEQIRHLVGARRPDLGCVDTWRARRCGRVRTDPSPANRLLKCAAQDAVNASGRRRRTRLTCLAAILQQPRVVAVEIGSLETVNGTVPRAGLRFRSMKPRVSTTVFGEKSCDA